MKKISAMVEVDLCDEMSKGGYLGGNPAKQMQFMVRAFRVMREIAIAYSKKISEEQENVIALLDYEFEERMK